MSVLPLDGLATATAAAFLGFVLPHDGAGGDFFGSLAVASGSLGGAFDVLVLTLLFGSGSSQMSFDCHSDLPFVLESESLCRDTIIIA
jgi:hypothetical protein